MTGLKKKNSVSEFLDRKKGTPCEPCLKGNSNPGVALVMRFLSGVVL